MVDSLRLDENTPFTSRCDFASRTIFVTGAASGIGRAVAIGLGQVGASLILTDVQTDAGEETAAKVLSAGGKSVFVSADVTSVEALEKALASGTQQLGTPDGAVNCAGINSSPAKIGDDTMDNWRKILDVNLVGVAAAVRTEVRALRAAERAGSIVNIASAAGLRALGGQAAYSASKFGIVGLTRSAAVEYARYGIRINAVCPGPIETPMVREFLETSNRASSVLTDGVALRRLGQPAEVADAVIWLLSGTSTYVTGAAIPVDGGFTA